jgi:hypothetical protein
LCAIKVNHEEEDQVFIYNWYAIYSVNFKGKETEVDEAEKLENDPAFRDKHGLLQDAFYYLRDVLDVLDKQNKEEARVNFEGGN